MVSVLSFQSFCSALALQEHSGCTHKHLWRLFLLTQRGPRLFRTFRLNLNTKKNEGEPEREQAAHTAKSLSSRNDSAIFCSNTNTYTKISLPHYAEITLISAGKIKSRRSIMKAGRASQLLCRIHRLPSPSAPLFCGLDLTERKGFWKSGGKGDHSWPEIRLLLPSFSQKQFLTAEL